MIAAIIAGQAYGHRATLELSQDTLTWRAHRGSLQKTAENIVTTGRSPGDHKLRETTT